jgi:uncharacterized protein (TIGR03435 family)
LKLALAIVAFVSATALHAQAQKFEVASIRPCRPGDDSGDDGRKGGRKGGGGPNPSPNRLVTGCETVESLIRSAYVLYATDQLIRDPSSPPIEGGPAWIRSEHYQVTAKADSAAGAGAMNGRLMRALLEERFKLKVHRQAKEVPVYAMTVAESGVRMTPWQPGSCTPMEPGTLAGTRPENPCRVLIRQRGPNLALEGKGATLAEIAKLLFLLVDHPVVDRTGLSGRFDIDVEFAPEQRPAAFRPPDEPSGPAPPAEEPTAPRIFTAFVKQLGLKLEAGNGPRESLLIDHVERPSRN